MGRKDRGHLQDLAGSCPGACWGLDAASLTAARVNWFQNQPEYHVVVAAAGRASARVLMWAGGYCRPSPPLPPGDEKELADWRTISRGGTPGGCSRHGRHREHLG